MSESIRNANYHEEYTIAVVCSGSLEMSAFRYMLDNEHPHLPAISGDPNEYVLGDLHGSNIVIACLTGQQDNVTAGIVVTNMSRTFPSIRHRLLVGTAGGVPSAKHDIRLGDVVVGMPEMQHAGVVQYDLGKDTDHGFILKGFLWPSPSRLTSVVEVMRSDHLTADNKIAEFVEQMVKKSTSLAIYRRPPANSDVLFNADYAHDPGRPSCEDCDITNSVQRAQRSPQGSLLHYGLIASGGRVLKSAKKRDEAVRCLGEVLCFEMTAAGPLTEFPCLVIRGISNYADSHKNDDWRHFAAAAAAACAKELLSYIDPECISSALVGNGMIIEGTAGSVPQLTTREQVSSTQAKEHSRSGVMLIMDDQ